MTRIDVVASCPWGAWAFRLALVPCDPLDEGVLFARVGESATRFEETVGEYASGAVRRFANLADSEDWLGLMNVVDRTDSSF